MQQDRLESMHCQVLVGFETQGLFTMESVNDKTRHRNKFFSRCRLGLKLDSIPILVSTVTWTLLSWIRICIRTDGLICIRTDGLMQFFLRC